MPQIMKIYLNLPKICGEYGIDSFFPDTVTELRLKTTYIAFSHRPHEHRLVVTIATGQCYNQRISSSSFSAAETR